MRAVRAIWNLGLLLAGMLAAWLILPKVATSLTPAAFQHFESLWIAVEGVGLLLLLALCLASLATWTWREIGRAPRLVYVIAGALFLAGSCTSAVIDHLTIGHVFWPDHVTFIAVVVVVAFPIVCLRVGYPGLVLRLWCRWRGRSTGA
ncbi:MAG: hypothetical protein ACYTGG_01665 [Planctomycetota bacterium]|jgi:hypothetical protein